MGIKRTPLSSAIILKTASAIEKSFHGIVGASLLVILKVKIATLTTKVNISYRAKSPSSLVVTLTSVFEEVFVVDNVVSFDCTEKSNR